MDGVAHRLGAAPEIFGDPRRTLSAGTGEKDLAAPEDEGIGGAQPCLQGLALLLCKRTYEDWRFHERYCNSSPTTCPADALGCWYLDAVLGRGLRDPLPTSGWSLQMSGPRLKVHGLAYLLEEPLVQASRCLAHQPPTQTLTDVLV